jgi:hypothetical protein
MSSMIMGALHRSFFLATCPQQLRYIQDDSLDGPHIALGHLM